VETVSGSVLGMACLLAVCLLLADFWSTVFDKLFKINHFPQWFFELNFQFTMEQFKCFEL